jgi:hypothetical protein
MRAAHGIADQRLKSQVIIVTVILYTRYEIVYTGLLEEHV